MTPRDELKAAVMKAMEDGMVEFARTTMEIAFQVIEAHTATTYHAYFAGFVPGFVYLGEVTAAIATPRRSTPRREVPAGSVAIAGTQTGVYPRTTPGGWNLIGHTDAILFDAAHGRALVEPGDQVRFIS